MNQQYVTHLDYSQDSNTIVWGSLEGLARVASFINKTVSWQNYKVLQTSVNQIRISNIQEDSEDSVEVGDDQIVNFYLQNGYLLVATSSKIFIWSLQNLVTPAIVTKSALSVLQTRDSFCVFDNQSINIYNYSGKLMHTPKIPGLKLNQNPKHFHFGNGLFAFLDPQNQKILKILDISQNKIIETLEHLAEIKEVQIGQFERKITILDQNKDLFVYVNGRGKRLFTICESFIWNEAVDVLAVIASLSLQLIYLPEMIFQDQEIWKQAQMKYDEIELRDCQII